jgi:glycosyltransferase involved in cell wall biosynthesis
MAHEKNYPLVLRAFAAMSAANPRLRYVFVGDGPLRSSLQRQFPNGVFTGFISRDDLARHYASADAFLYPSLTETFGNVVTESMASGLAVCAYNYAAAARYVRHRENGLLVALDDETDFISRSVELARDTRLRRSLGLIARATAENIPWGRVIDGFARDLREVASSSPEGHLPSPSPAQSAAA